jgi:hypothetical protein
MKKSEVTGFSEGEAGEGEGSDHEKDVPQELKDIHIHSGD